MSERRACILSASGRIAGLISIASLPLARTSLLGRAINATLAAHPALRVEIEDGSYNALLARLRGGERDILIGALRQPAPVPDVAEEPLFLDPYAVVGRRDHPLLTRGPATLADLVTQNWVIPRKGTPIRAAFDHLFSTKADVPEADVETSSLVLTRSILVESDRLTLLSKRQIVIDAEAGLLTDIPLAGDLPAVLTGRMIGIATRQDWLPSPAQKLFLDALRREAQDSKF